MTSLRVLLASALVFFATANSTEAPTQAPATTTTSSSTEATATANSAEAPVTQAPATTTTNRGGTGCVCSRQQNEYGQGATCSISHAIGRNYWCYVEKDACFDSKQDKEGGEMYYSELVCEYKHLLSYALQSQWDMCGDKRVIQVATAIECSSRCDTQGQFKDLWWKCQAFGFYIAPDERGVETKKGDCVLYKDKASRECSVTKNFCEDAIWEKHDNKKGFDCGDVADYEWYKKKKPSGRGSGTDYFTKTDGKRCHAPVDGSRAECETCFHPDQCADAPTYTCDPFIKKCVKAFPIPVYTEADGQWLEADKSHVCDFPIASCGSECFNATCLLQTCNECCDRGKLGQGVEGYMVGWQMKDGKMEEVRMEWITWANLKFTSKGTAFGPRPEWTGEMKIRNCQTQGQINEASRGLTRIRAQTFFGVLFVVCGVFTA